MARRTPAVIQPAGDGTDEVHLESYDDQDHRYLRIVVTTAQMRIGYHPASDGDAAKMPDNSVGIDLARCRLVRSPR